jgi:hypothetical protein
MGCEVPCQRGGALPGECSQRLQFDGLSQLSLGTFSMAAAMRSQPQVKVAQVSPRQSPSLADVHDLRTERFHLR